MCPPPPSATLFPYTTLFRSRVAGGGRGTSAGSATGRSGRVRRSRGRRRSCRRSGRRPGRRRGSRSEATLHRSEEHTSELQSHSDLVCRLLLEKKKNST